MAKGKTPYANINLSAPALNTGSDVQNYYSPATYSPYTGGGSYMSPNITWQNTSSGATYSSAASVLKTC